MRHQGFGNGSMCHVRENSVLQTLYNLRGKCCVPGVLSGSGKTGFFRVSLLQDKKFVQNIHSENRNDPKAGGRDRQEEEMMGIFSWILIISILLILFFFFPHTLSAFFRNWRITIPVSIGLIAGWLFYGWWQRLDPSGYLTRYIWILKPVVLVISVHFFLKLSRELFRF